MCLKIYFFFKKTIDNTSESNKTKKLNIILTEHRFDLPLCAFVPEQLLNGQNHIDSAPVARTHTHTEITHASSSEKIGTFLAFYCDI